MTDAALVARARAGDVDSFTALVQRYYDECWRFAVRQLGDRSDAEDALQETFIRAHRGLARYEEREQFRGWLYRILVNQCHTAAAQRKRLGDRFVRDENELLGAAAEPLHDVGVADALQAALAQLDPAHREAVLLKYGEGLGYNEMSSITGASVSALKMRVKRACEALRPLLEEWHT